MTKYKKKTRAQLRGKQLDKDCHKAKISKHECGPDDERNFCLGLFDAMTDEHVEKCQECNACVMFVDPMEE